MKRLKSSSVMKMLDVRSTQTLRDMVKRGALPKPFMDEGGCCNYWLESEIEEVLKAQAEKRINKMQMSK